MQFTKESADTKPKTFLFPSFKLACLLFRPAQHSAQTLSELSFFIQALQPPRAYSSSQEVVFPLHFPASTMFLNIFLSSVSNRH